MRRAIRTCALWLALWPAMAAPSAAQCQITTIRAEQPEQWAHFGESVAVAGDVTVIGSPAGWATVVMRGAAGEWTIHTTLTMPETIGFGGEVAADGEWVFVGARQVGRVHGFRWNGSGWPMMATLDVPPEDAGNFFGEALAIDGDVMVVGAWRDNDNGMWAGAAYVYRWDGQAWGFEAKLLASDGEADDGFGAAVAIDGEKLAVGADGRVYVFRAKGAGSWEEEAILVASDENQLPRPLNFGWAVDVSGDLVVAGASGDDEVAQGAGAAYVFRYLGIGWQEEAKLLAADGEASDRLGVAVGVDQERVVAGAYRRDDCGKDTGAAYLFEHDGRNWGQAGRMLGNGARPGDSAGLAIAIDGALTIVGAQGADSPGESPTENSGAAFIFDGPCVGEVGYCAPAEALVLEDEQEWIDAVGDFTTITFCELPPYTWVTDQYRELGVTFGAFNTTIQQCGCPDDDCGLDGNDVIDLTFTPPQRWIALAYPGGMQVALWAGEDKVFTSDELNNSGPDFFAGVVSGRPFDRAVLTCPAEQQVFLNDLHFGASLAGDTDFDNVVDVRDLVSVILDWGMCVGPPLCLADLDFDGVVGHADVGVVIANWSGR
jgi:hypothetical protein